MTSRAANPEAFETVAEMGAIDVAFLDRVTFRDRVLAREVLVLFDRQADGLLDIIANTEKQYVRHESAHKLEKLSQALVEDAADIKGEMDDKEPASPPS